jgi:hypothetical protein
MKAAAAAGSAAEIHEIMRRLRKVLEVDADANDGDDLLHPATTQLFNELTPTWAGNSGEADG